MTKRHRSFEVKTRTQQEKEFDSLEFDLGDETFHCVRAMPGAVVLRFVASASDSDAAGKSAENILNFLDRVIVPEDLDRFHALIEDPDRLVEIETLTEIIGWLVEEYTGRPTEASVD